MIRKGHFLVAHTYLIYLRSSLSGESGIRDGMTPVGTIQIPKSNPESEPLIHAVVLDHCEFTKGVT